MSPRPRPAWREPRQAWLPALSPVDDPDHPPGDAEKHLAELGSPLTARDRLARAERLSDGRGWDQALVDLALIDDHQPDDVRTLRDYWIGMTLFVVAC